jgi:DNA-binding response OmpR family regulator
MKDMHPASTPWKGSEILVVEDDEAIRDAMRELLEDEGYQVTTAKQGREALSILEVTDHIPNVILLDLMMPEMDGWEFCGALRKIDRLASIPVLLLSAHTQASERVESLSVAGLLTKPLDIDKLLVALKSLTLS